MNKGFATPHLMIVLALVAIAAIVFFVMAIDDNPPSDEAAIKELLQEAGEEFNDGEWGNLADLCWPPERREDLVAELNAYGYLKGHKADLPVKISDLTIRENVATCKMTVTGGYILGNGRWDETFTATFRRHEGEWLIDAEATRKSINDRR